MTSDTSKLTAVRCAWVTPVLGVDGRLLYLGPLFRALSRCFCSFVVVTGEFLGGREEAGFQVERCGTFGRMYANERATTRQVGAYRNGIGFATPAVFLRFVLKPVDLLIVAEFSLYAGYAALATLLARRTRILWIVETRPRQGSSRSIAGARRMFRRLLATRGDAFLTNNADGYDYLVKELRVDPTRVLVHPFLVSELPDAGRPRLPRTVSDAEPVRFLYVGQLIRRKGIYVALEAARLLQERVSRPFVLEIVGDGTDRSHLEEFAVRHGLTHCAIFRGRVPYTDLHSIYSAAHVFVFPTLSDYRALAPFEALSSGLPIIASRNDGGVAETVEEGRNGFAFDPSDAAELAARMEHFLKSPEDVTRFSSRSLQMAERYTLQGAIDGLRAAAIRALGTEVATAARQNG